MGDFIVKYWVQVLFAFIVWVVVEQYKKACETLKTATERNDALKLGVQALLRDRIIQCYNQYRERGYMPIYARENVDALYKQYHNLGGNGTIDHLIYAMCDLPTDPKGENYEY